MVFDDERAEGLRDPIKDDTTDMEFQKLKQLETTCLVSCSQSDSSRDKEATLRETKDKVQWKIWKNVC